MTNLITTPQLGIFVDRSASMSTKDILVGGVYYERTQIVNHLIQSVSGHKALVTGADFGYFKGANDYLLKKHVLPNTKECFRILDELADGGSTCISELLARYFALSKNRKDHGFFERERNLYADSITCRKPNTSLVIFTDGLLHDFDKTKELIIEHSQTLTHHEEFKINFIQIGNDPGLEVYHELANIAGMKYMVVNVFSLAKVIKNGFGPMLNTVIL